MLPRVSSRVAARSAPKTYAHSLHSKHKKKIEGITLKSFILTGELDSDKCEKKPQRQHLVKTGATSEQYDSILRL